MFIMYNILSTFIIPMKGISKQTSDLLFFFFFFKISYLFIKIQGVYAPPVKSSLFCPEPIASDYWSDEQHYISYNLSFFVITTNLLCFSTSSICTRLYANKLKDFSPLQLRIRKRIRVINIIHHWVKRRKRKFKSSRYNTENKMQ